MLSDPTELIDGVTQCMIHYGSVRAGEHVLIINETTTDPAVTAAFRAVGKAAGATVYVLTVDPITQSTPVSDVIGHAMAAADVAFGVISWPRIWRSPAGVRARMAYGTRYVSLATMATVACLRSAGARWPIELYYFICRRLYRMALTKKTIRVTDPRGTDVRARVDPLFVFMGEEGPMLPGEFRVFPVGETVVGTSGTAEGVVSYDGFYMFGMTSEPLTITIENGWATKVAGGREARLLKKHWSRIPNANHFVEISWGLNPRMDLDFSDPTMNVGQRNSSIVHMGFGDSQQYGGSVYCRTKLNGTVTATPSVWMDDEVFVDHGRMVILDDPAVRAYAARFGDPDILLADREII